jgi:cytochrome b
MKPVLVWDLPTRLFHWLLASGCLAAFGLALASPEHSRMFDLHMLCGLFLLPLLAFRVIWGLVGSRYASFRSFLYHPGEAFEYLVGLVRRTAPRHPGHNPAAGYAILAMLVLVIASVGSGLLIPGSKIFKELHEIVSNVLLAIIGAHLLGVLFHTVVHRENVVLSMLTGTKIANEGEGIAGSHHLIALLFLVLTGSWCAAVVTNYDAVNRKLELPLIGTTIQLGKIDHHNGVQLEDDDD